MLEVGKMVAFFHSNHGLLIVACIEITIMAAQPFSVSKFSRMI